MIGSVLDLNDHLFGKPREVACLTLAALLHIPLFFWRGKPYSDLMGDPLVSVDFVVEREKKEPEPPPPPKEVEKQTFFKKVTQKLGLAQKPIPKIKVDMPKETKLAGMDDANKIKTAPKVKSVMPTEQLQDKSPKLSGAIQVASIKTSGNLVTGSGPGGGTIKDKSTAFRVSARDIPVAVRKGGDGSDEYAPRLALADKSDKGIKKISTDFLGTGGGTGGGSGSGSGGSLKDKSTEGLSGASSGFDGNVIDKSAVRQSSLKTGLAGGGQGSSGGQGSRAPYEITGDLSGRKILHQVLPPYPDWAREKGLFAVVSIEFSVFHSGQVNVSSMMVKRSSGYPQLDTLVQDSLAQWRFEPLDASQYGVEQKGTITFKFKAI